VVQGPNDPAHGFYVSATSLEDRSRERADPLRYVDATQVPYIVLPPEFITGRGTALGDLAAVIRARDRIRSEAIFADVGPRRKLGEGSVALADALGITSDPRSGGIGDGVIYLIFPGSGDGRPCSTEEIGAVANGLFEEFGGMGQVDSVPAGRVNLATVLLGPSASRAGRLQEIEMKCDEQQAAGYAL